jgi:threonine synthase|tara:strand:- start:1042 stop:2106 length:1065 start_codon:yes stop_codon:yes gene_type:complete
MPSLESDAVITLNEGDTPLYDVSEEFASDLGIELLLKHEGMNPTLSFKDRGMVAGVSWAKNLGCEHVICASTGDTSASMAAYAACAGGMKGIVLLPKGKISQEQLVQPISCGALTIGLETDFDGCMKLVQELTAKHAIYLLNSMNSVRIEGQKAIGIETLHQLNWKVPDWFVIPVGNAGNISALGKGLRELKKLGIIDHLPRLAGVQTASASPLYKSYRKGFTALVPQVADATKASAIRIGNPVSFKKAVRELKYFEGVVEMVTETELMNWKARIERVGIAICPNSAVAVAGVKKLVDSGIISEGEKVVVLLTAHGSKFSSSTMGYHDNAENRYANQPVYLPAELAAIEKVLKL